jgi:adenine-specific DNA methylase
MTDTPRLIEHAFPLKQTSLDSLHEKNIRQGHISTLHVWPARRPLAACRAALIATLVPDPGTPKGRKELCEKIGGRVIRKMEKKKMPGGSTVEREKELTEGGFLRWLGEEPTSGGQKKRAEWLAKKKQYEQDLVWFREEILKAYGGRPPKVLDPFAGGGAIPLEAMRLGCEVTAIDINPVAWFILKCTLEYPQHLAGQKWPLPAFILENREFMTAFRKAHGMTGVGLFDHLLAASEATESAEIKPKKAKKTRSKKAAPSSISEQAFSNAPPLADLAWHVRAWGQWVLGRVRKELAKFYPVYADFEPLDPGIKSFEKQPMRLVSLRDDGSPDIGALNGEFSAEYLGIRSNPRWVAKPAVAYLWARTVTCKNCRATIPLLKTRWLARTDRQRVLLFLNPLADRLGVEFSIQDNVPRTGQNNAQRREHDKRLGSGTMSRAGATCPMPGCGTIMTMEDMQVEGQAGRLGQIMTAVAVDTSEGKSLRLPTEEERQIALVAPDVLETIFSHIPHGIPSEYLVEDAKRNTWCVQYGVNRFNKLFTDRQLAGMGTLIKHIRSIRGQQEAIGYSGEWIEAIICYLASTISRLADYFNCGAQWKLDRATINHLFVRYALPISWDFAEGNVLGDLPGSFEICLKKIAIALDTFTGWSISSPAPAVIRGSSISTELSGRFDAVVTDPPYYNAIGYAVLMDYFYVWLRRTLAGLSPEFDHAFATPLTPKWDSETSDGELVDDSSRHEGDANRSKAAYETGMERVFANCQDLLTDTGRLVIVFAHKDPDAWETLVSAMIRSGFVVDASWPIQTEQASRMRAQSSAALASSVWLVCKKRPATAQPGWDNKVLDEMRANIGRCLRKFWDAGIRGPDFVWASTGPALEAYSKYPVVKMADEAGKVLTVSDFLSQARRMVVDYVVGRVLSGDDADAAPMIDRLDEPTAYYLLHRHDFGLNDAPVGACILYATACGLSDDSLIRDWDLIVKTGGEDAADDTEEEEDSDESDEPSEESGSGSKVKLKAWNHRRGRSLGLEAPGGRPVPMIDRIHRLMLLWKGGDVHKVDEYLDEHGLRRHELFRRVLQSLIELSRTGGEERSLLESISNHVGAKGAKKKEAPSLVFDDDEVEDE